MRAIIFDLDGVVVDTARYHYLAWKELSHSLGFEFDIVHNERLKGVSRMASLEVVLEVGNIMNLTFKEKAQLADRKNKIYLSLISELNQSDILPGVIEFLDKMKSLQYKIALGSASKSGKMILDKLKLSEYFDVIVDGNLVQNPKPDPEVFIKAADSLHIPYNQCIVVEDSKAGIEAANIGGMHSIGIGKYEILKAADIVIESTINLPKINLNIIFE